MTDRQLSQISVGFTQPQLQWLRSEARRLGLNIAELVRRIIDACREQPK